VTWAHKREGGKRIVELWFWGWLVVAAAAAVVEAVIRDRSAVPFAVGAASAAGVEAMLGEPAWEWAVFIAVSSVLFVALNRRRYRKRHSHDPKGRHSRSRRSAVE
jgi:membrane protein implicated in regulation of membrane protease activity